MKLQPDSEFHQAGASLEVQSHPEPGTKQHKLLLLLLILSEERNIIHSAPANMLSLTEP